MGRKIVEYEKSRKIIEYQKTRLPEYHNKRVANQERREKNNREKLISQSNRVKSWLAEQRESGTIDERVYEYGVKLIDGGIESHS